MPTSNVVVDLSHSNANADFNKAKADGILGVVHKATQGTGFVDQMYAKRRKAAAAAGLLWGAYHFGTGADPIAQAQSFLKVASPTAKDILVLDFEENTTTPGNDMTLVQARAFIGFVQKATGVMPGLYGGAMLAAKLGSSPDPLLGACWLWGRSIARRLPFRRIGRLTRCGNTPMDTMAIRPMRLMASVPAIAISIKAAWLICEPNGSPERCCSAPVQRKKSRTLRRCWSAASFSTPICSSSSALLRRGSALAW